MARSFNISRQMVWDSYLKIKANKGSAGIDRQTMDDFEKDLSKNLYKIWNRLTSGSYFPPAVHRVDIPKGNGKTRPLGIPTISDRIAQMVVKDILEPIIDPSFHHDSTDIVLESLHWMLFQQQDSDAGGITGFWIWIFAGSLLARPKW